MIDGWINEATSAYKNMEMKTGIGYATFKCEIGKFRDEWSCKRDPDICSEKDWVVD